MFFPVPAFNLKRKRNWPCIIMFLMSFLSFLYYFSGQGFMDQAKREGVEYNIAFVMELKRSKDGSQSRFVYRFKQCLASICQRSSTNLTVHIFANSVGREESLKVLKELTAYCTTSYKVKFYDVDEVITNILPSINVIKVSECHLNVFCTLETLRSVSIILSMIHEVSCFYHLLLIENHESLSSAVPLGSVDFVPRLHTPYCKLLCYSTV